jgi:hypothetical protein
MATLKGLDLVEVLREVVAAGRTLVGICLGMQLLMTESHEFVGTLAYASPESLLGKEGKRSPTSDLYSLGGMPGASFTPDASCWVLRKAAASWQPIVPLPVARGAAFAAAIGGKIYVAGGVGPGSSILAKIAIYDPAADAWKDGVQLFLTAILQAPHFLYRAEVSSGTAQNGRVPLSEWEIASRLSYGLTASMPDDALFAAAVARKLGTRDGVLEEARRLLGLQAASMRTFDDFHYQYLNLARYELATKDTMRYPQWTGIGATMLRDEANRFVRDVVMTKDKGLADLLLSPAAFVNGRLAALYGLAMPAPPVAGAADPFVPVMLDPTQRAGILTRIGFLASYADGAQPQTILRGAYINHDILCADLPPPPDAFNLPPAVGKTNRQRIEAGTHVAACAGCHQNLINPPGFALGGFSMGETASQMDEMVEYTVSLLPDSKPRYLMGVGMPRDILAAVRAGVDLFDCILPTRMGRNAMAFTSSGMVRIRNAEFARDEKPLDPGCSCPCCRSYSRAYLRHCFGVKEILGPKLLSLHNVHHYGRLMQRIRAAIREEALEGLMP